MPVNNDEIIRHNTVTREIIAGVLVECRESDQSITETSQRIMSVINRRGYVPQIKSCNQLKDGRFI